MREIEISRKKSRQHFDKVRTDFLWRVWGGGGGRVVVVERGRNPLLKGIMASPNCNFCNYLGYEFKLCIPVRCNMESL